MTKGYASPLTTGEPPPTGVCSKDEDDEPFVAVILRVEFDLFNSGGGGRRPLLAPRVSPVTTAPTSPIADLMAPIPSAIDQYTKKS